jgi:hypothetical protein
VSHDENILLSFEFHDHWLKSDNNVSVRFAPCIIKVFSTIQPLPTGNDTSRTAISIIELVLITVGKVFRVRVLHTYTIISRFQGRCFSYLDFLIGHPITDPCIELIQRLPGFFGIGKFLCRLHCTLEGGSPNLCNKRVVTR